MVLCSTECVKMISHYLDLSFIKFHVSENNIVASDNLLKNVSVEGFTTIVQALAMNSKHKSILGENDITRAITQQWLEFAALYVNYADISTNAKKVLKELNIALKNNTYISGTKKTIADLALYYALYSIIKGLSNQEKAEYVNVSRWFDNIQQDEKTRQNLDLINFSAVSLYL